MSVSLRGFNFGTTGDLWRMNEPGGMTTLLDRPFAALNEDNWHDDDVPTAVFEFTTDASEPQSPSTIGRANYLAGHTAGTSPVLSFDNVAGKKHVYYCFTLKVSSNWVGNGAQTNKVFYTWCQTPNVEGFYMSGQGSGANSLIAYAMVQGIVLPVDSTNYPPNLVPAANITRGQWAQWEFLLTGNDASTANGGIDWWKDGVHIGSVTGIQWTTSATQFTEVDLRPVWGGVETDPAITETQTMDFGHFYASGKD